MILQVISHHHVAIRFNTSLLYVWTVLHGYIGYIGKGCFWPLPQNKSNLTDRREI